MNREQRNHTLFAIDTGPNVEVLGEYPNYLTPGELVTLPTGRTMLTARTVPEVRQSFGRLAVAWEAGGLGAFAVPDERRHPLPPGPETPPEGVGWVPDGQRQDVYLYRDGTWFLWKATDYPQWHTLTVVGNNPPRCHPINRAYGASYELTRHLDLGQLAVWILAEATARAHWRTFPFSAHVIPGTDVDSPRIDIAVYGVPYAQRPEIATELEVIAARHNWSNPCDPDDERFRFTVRLPRGDPDTPGTPTGTITINHAHSS